MYVWYDSTTETTCQCKTILQYLTCQFSTEVPRMCTRSLGQTLLAQSVGEETTGPQGAIDYSNITSSAVSVGNRILPAPVGGLILNLASNTK
jgi:hypothetical protein